MLQECLYTGVQEVGGASSEHAPEGSQVDVVEKCLHILLNDFKRATVTFMYSQLE